MVERSDSKMWIVTIAAIAIIVIAVGFVVVNYVIPKPDSFVGQWNGTVQYNGTYYDSIFQFNDNYTAQAAYYFKPGLTRNITQPTTGPLFTEKMTWEAEGDHYNIIYPDGKVKLYNDGVAHTLRFSETEAAGYKTSFEGYISRYYGSMQDFDKINRTK
jgi:hypothetical protein